MRTVRFSVPAIGCVLLLGFAASAHAQQAGMVMNPFGNFVPNTGFGGGMTMTPQMNMMMGMRMMQGFGGGGVQTGVPNPIISGGYGSQPQLYNEPTGSSSSSKHHGSKKNSHSKRDEARAQRAEQKRAAAAAKIKPKAEKVAKKSRKQKDPPQ